MNSRRPRNPEPFRVVNWCMRSTRRKLLAAGGLLVAIAVVLGVTASAVHLRRVDDEAAAARSATVVADRDADTVDRQLADALASLDELRNDLRAASGALGTAADERSVGRSDHAAALADLQWTDGLLLGLQQALAGIEQEAAGSSTLLDALSRCLDRAADAMMQLAVGDERGAITTLTGGTQVCAAAGMALG